MPNQRIDLLEYRGNGSTAFTGRAEGKLARHNLNLSEKDKDGFVYDVIIPKNTTSINSSFFLGLFYESIKTLGSIEEFEKKYLFVIEEEDAEWKAILECNLAECCRRANNELNHTTGIDFDFSL